MKCEELKSIEIWIPYLKMKWKYSSFHETFDFAMLDWELESYHESSDTLSFREINLPVGAKLFTQSLLRINNEHSTAFLSWNIKLIIMWSDSSMHSLKHCYGFTRDSLVPPIDIISANINNSMRNTHVIKTILLIGGKSYDYNVIGR